MSFAPVLPRFAARLGLLAAVTGLLTGTTACRRAPEAPSGNAARGDERPARVTVAVEPAAVAPGCAASLLWRFEPSPGWHLYWDGRNDSGFAPRQRLQLPPGWSAGPLRWPVPVRHVAAGDILDHVYPGAFTLVQEVTAPPTAAPGARVVVDARWDWLACRDACVPGRDSLTVALVVAGAAGGAAAAAGEVAAGGHAGELAAARDRLPRALPEGFLRVTREGGTWALERRRDVPGGRLTFMPANDCGELVDLLRDGAGERLVLRLREQDGRWGPLRGLVVAEEPSSAPQAYFLDLPAVPSPAGGGQPLPPAHPTGGRS